MRVGFDCTHLRRGGDIPGRCHMSHMDVAALTQGLDTDGGELA